GDRVGISQPNELAHVIGEVHVVAAKRTVDPGRHANHCRTVDVAAERCGCVYGDERILRKARGSDRLCRGQAQPQQRDAEHNVLLHVLLVLNAMWTMTFRRFVTSPISIRSMNSCLRRWQSSAPDASPSTRRGAAARTFGGAAKSDRGRSQEARRARSV